MFSISNKQLKKLKPANLFATCPNCFKKHRIKYGEKVLPDGTKEKSNLLGFVNCKKESYLVSVEGKLL